MCFVGVVCCCTCDEGLFLWVGCECVWWVDTDLGGLSWCLVVFAGWLLPFGVGLQLCSVVPLV